MAGFQKVPKSISSLVGSPTAFGEARKWAAAWQEGKVQKPLLVFGPTGTGKTALAHAIAAEFGWDLFEFNASDLRDEASVMSLLPNAAGSNSLTGARKLILIDDVDSLSGSSDRRGGAAIAKAIADSRQPIILTALDYYDKKLSTIRALCMPLEIRRVHVSSVASFVKKTAVAHGIKLADGDAEKIAESVKGDLRAALNDLEAGNFSSMRDREKNVFDVIRLIFKSEKYSEARNATMAYEDDHNTLKTWIAHNLPLEYERPYDLAEAYATLSRADIFDGRISRAQYWGYLRYSSDLMSAGVALSKTSPYHKYTAYSYPDIIRKMGSSKASRATRKSVLRKISLYCHCSLTQAAGYLFLLGVAGEEKPEETAAIFGFDEDEMEFIGGTRFLHGKKGPIRASSNREEKKAVRKRKEV